MQSEETSKNTAPYHKYTVETVWKILKLVFRYCIYIIHIIQI